jgi:lysozyme
MQEIILSLKGKALTEFFEGRKSKAYQDSGGIWTIGIGHTKNVKSGMIITETKIDELFAEDIQDAIQRTKDCLTKEATQGELDALINQAFNLRSFGKLVYHFNIDKKVWRMKTLFYCKDVKGNFLKGLKIRRISEVLLSDDRDRDREWLEFAKWAQLKSTSIQMILDKEKELFKNPAKEISEIEKLSTPRPLEPLPDQSKK